MFTKQLAIQPSSDGRTCGLCPHRWYDNSTSPVRLLCGVYMVVGPLESGRAEQCLEDERREGLAGRTGLAAMDQAVNVKEAD